MALTDETSGTDSQPPAVEGPTVSVLQGRVEGVLDERLPRGQHDLPRQFVAQHQRTRILEAMTGALHDVGYLDLTVADVVKRARVSRRTFYEHFADKQQAYVAAFGAGVECVAEAVRTAYAAEQPWEDRVAAAFSTVMRLMIAHPATGYTCLVQGGISGAEAERCRLAAMRMSADAFGGMLKDCEPAAPVSPLHSELAVGALCELIRARISEGRQDELPAELPETVAALLTGAIGAHRAQNIAARIDRLSRAGANGQHATHP